MKELLKKNGIIFGIAILAAIILTLAVTSFEWSFKTFSDMLSYVGIAVMLYGAFVASNVSGLFKSAKRNLNARYSPEEKAENDKKIKAKLINGWFTIFVGGVIVVLSIAAIRV